MAPRVRLTMLLGVVGALLAACGCNSTAPLRDVDLDAFTHDPPVPTGLLEQSDARRLAYRVLGAEQVRAALTHVGSQIPGLNLSSLFATFSDPTCRTVEGTVLRFSFPCLGLPSGTLWVRPLGESPNANGDYALAAESVTPETGPGFSGDMRMRVQGIANPDVPERFVLSLRTVTAGVSDYFAAVERTALVVENSAATKEVWLYIEVEGGSFWVRGFSVAGESMNWKVLDLKNTWTCESQVDGTSLPTSTCRTPVDGSGYGVLEF